MNEGSYVSNTAWVRPAGRPDAVDDVADQFERPVAEGMIAFWAAGSAVRWPCSPRGWRPIERMHGRAIERRAG
jgi:hypothetical protein